MRTRFQSGSLTKERRSKGSDVWAFRWRELDQDSSVKRRKMIVGTVEEYRTESHAKKALAAPNLKINESESRSCHPALLTVGALVKHYKDHELGANRSTKAQSTCDLYQIYLDR